ncbi:hypothetical protein JW992_07825 [candidate division KSB1 bacterium]|nr:hypothetical protein [candidate division KSB1 bacterium]
MNALQVLSSSKGLQIVADGLARLDGGRPSITDRPIGASRLVQEDDCFSFGHDFHVHMDRCSTASLVAFSLSIQSEITPITEPLGLSFETLPDCRYGIAYWRYGPFNSWTTPLRFSSCVDLPHRDVQFAFWQYTDGLFGAAIPLGGEGFRTTLGTVQGALAATADNGRSIEKIERLPLVAFGVGNDLYALVDQLYRFGLQQMQIPENHIDRKSFPAVFERIGWCTWNASELGTRLDEALVVHGVKSFTDRGFPLGWLLIDDGWFEHRDGKLCSLLPDRQKFPQGFAPVVERLKNETGIKDVGIWHTLNGYWNGIDRESELGRELAGELFEWTQIGQPGSDSTEPHTFSFIRPDSALLSDFYQRWHRWFRQQGISFIKVDNQLVVERMCRNTFPIWQLSAALHRALNESVVDHFDGAMINCMDMTPDAYYLFGSTAVGRGVEDYYPHSEELGYDPLHGNAAVHVLQAIYNAVWFSQMVFSDFDMFQSHHPQAVFHAVARALHNGPIYLTDTPGQQELDVLWPLIGRDGRILRADTPLRPSPACLFQLHDPLPFKAFSFSNGCGMLGIWNCADADRVEGDFSCADLPGLEGAAFAVFDYFAGTFFWMTRSETRAIALQRLDCRLYTFVPVQQDAAVLGLREKYNAPKTVKAVERRGNTLHISLTEGGTLVAATRHAPLDVRVDGQPVDSHWHGGLLSIPLVHHAGSPVVEIELGHSCSD